MGKKFKKSLSAILGLAMILTFMPMENITVKAASTTYSYTFDGWWTDPSDDFDVEEANIVAGDIISVTNDYSSNIHVILCGGASSPWDGSDSTFDYTLEPSQSGQYTIPENYKVSGIIQGCNIETYSDDFIKITIETATPTFDDRCGGTVSKVNAGYKVTPNVTADGMTYQWYKVVSTGDVAVDGQTSDTLTTYDEATDYYCKMTVGTFSFNSETVTTARLITSLTITSHPTKAKSNGTGYKTALEDGTSAKNSDFVIATADQDKYELVGFASYYLPIGRAPGLYTVAIFRPKDGYAFAYPMTAETAAEYKSMRGIDAQAGDYAETWKVEEITVHVHDFSGEWTVSKEATATTDGKKETICKNGCGTKKVVTIPATGVAEEDSSNGKLDKDAQVANDAPVDSASLDNSKTELMEATGIFTAAEKTAIQSGQDAKVYLQIVNKDEAEIDAADQTKMEAAADQELGENPIIEYMDVSLFKQIGDGEAEAVHEPGTDIEVTIEIPEEMLVDTKGLARKYRILRLHDGVVETISGTFNYETNEFTFSTDKFSTYAIAYSDEAMNLVISTPNDNATLSKIGGTLQLEVTVTPAEDANQTVTYKSSDEKVVTVNGTGLVTAVGPGTATITVTTEDGSVSKQITITVNATYGAGNTAATNTTPVSTAPVITTTAAPKTGDANNLWIWLMILAAGLGVSSLTLLRRKNQ